MQPWPTWLRLSLSHVLFLAGVCGYIGGFFPNERAMAGIFFCGGLLGEIVSWSRRIMVAEAVLLATAGAVWLAFRPESREQWHAVLGLAMASWLLVPSRLGWLRWLVPLAALEVLYLGINAESPRQARLASFALLPISLGALAADSWLMATSGARSSARSRPPLLAMARWSLAPALAAVVLAMLAGHLINRQEKPYSPYSAGTGASLANPSQKTEGLRSPTIGEPGQVTPDLDIYARLSWTSDSLPEGMVYLRAMCFDFAATDGDKISWRAPSVDEATGVARQAPDPAHECWVYRAPSDNDVVLHPDVSDAVDLDGLLGDSVGNLYRTGLGDSPRVYRCSLDEQVRAAPAGEESRYLGIDTRLRDFLPWEDIELGQGWSTMRPEDAAQAIATAIQSRCHYSLDLPTPMHGSGGALRTFLFDPNPQNRVGHCQYYATAEVLLLRHTGHPARLVIGFASTERDEQGVTFRGINAHAWCEYIDSHHDWRRIDPTPASDIARSLAEIAPADLPPMTPAILSQIAADRSSPQAVAEHQAATRSQARHLALGLGAAVAGVVLGWAVLRVARRPRRDPRLVMLERRADDLFNLAITLGIPVNPSTTLAGLTETLEMRTGMDLSRWRDAHLAARYGAGPIPEPWPYAQMREGARARGRARS